MPRWKRILCRPIRAPLSQRPLPALYKTKWIAEIRQSSALSFHKIPGLTEYCFIYRIDTSLRMNNLLNVTPRIFAMSDRGSWPDYGARCCIGSEFLDRGSRKKQIRLLFSVCRPKLGIKHLVGDTAENRPFLLRRKQSSVCIDVNLPFLFPHKIHISGHVDHLKSFLIGLA